MPSYSISRREVMGLAGALAFGGARGFGAAPFWTRKEAREWSPDEIEQLKTNSPWARKIELRMSGRSMDTGGSRGSFGGISGADSNGVTYNRGGRRGGGEQVRTPEVFVRWESSTPMREATRWSQPLAFEAHYAISVTGLPPAVLIVGVAGTGGAAASAGEDPAARQRASIQRLLAATTLSAKGYDAQPAAFVVQSADHASLIFAFAKSALPLSLDDRDVVFAMELGSVKIQAKFQPKEMTFQGRLSL